MSMLPVINAVKEYNQGRESCFDYDKTYELTDEDNKKLDHIATLIRIINPKCCTSLQVCKHSGQVYVRCTDKPQGLLPPIKDASKKV